jgi:hypothetical protein
MNLSQARDMIRNILVAPGSEQKWRIPLPLIDQVVNSQCQLHFEKTKALTGYWVTPAVEGQDEYNLPEGIVSTTLVKLAGERYYPAPFPYVEDAKRTGDGTYTTEGGTVVSNTIDRWYWKEGDKLRIHPEPEQSTSADVTGTITIPGGIVGSIVTVTTGDLGAVNSQKRKLVLLGSNYHTITANSATTFTVDGTPAGTEAAYTIYNHGIQIWGIRRPDDLIIGSDDAIPGSDVDAMAISYGAALEMAMTLPDKRKASVNVQGLQFLYNQYFTRAMKSTNTKNFAPIAITPWTFRSDHAGRK